MRAWYGCDGQVGCDDSVDHKGIVRCKNCGAIGRNAEKRTASRECCGIDTCVRYSCEGQEEDTKMAASRGA